MKNILRLSLLFICLIVMVGCGKKDDNKLVMVTEAGFAPYEYYENGEIVGVDVDIAKEIAKAENKDVDFNALIQVLWANVDNYVVLSSVPQMLLFMNDYQYKHQFVVDKEINTMAFFVEVMVDIEFMKVE